MFLFEPLPWNSIVMWFVVLGGLILLNELGRLNKCLPWECSLFCRRCCFCRMALHRCAGSSVGTWFHGLRSIPHWRLQGFLAHSQYQESEHQQIRADVPAADPLDQYS
jgi:hypothetical protein